MKIGLHNSDNTSFPNIALMKISAYHKTLGDQVDWFYPLLSYDKVYSSKIFTFTNNDPYLIKDMIKGGTGYDIKSKLPEEIDRLCPDYSLYNCDKSYGFLTRGCPNKCKWCFVPEKEGDIKPYMDIKDFARHKEVILMDNNVLASNYGIKQIEKIIRLGLKIDFNQGLDARLIDDSMAKLLSRVSWIRYIRLACDTKNQIPYIKKALNNLNKYGVKNYRIFVYVLVKDIPDALERILFLKEKGVNPFCQPFINKNGDDPKKEFKKLARWVNHKAIFKTVKWEDYKY